MTTAAKEISSLATGASISSFFTDYIGIISVKAYGALGDNATDDTQAITNAKTAATSLGVDSLFFPPGTYKVNASLDLTGFYLWGCAASFNGISRTIEEFGHWILMPTSVAQGDIFYYNGTDFTRLPAGTSGYYLKTQGAGANPIWSDPITSINSSLLLLKRKIRRGVVRV